VLTRMAGTAVGVLVARPIVETMLATSLTDICSLLSVDTLTSPTRWYNRKLVVLRIRPNVGHILNRMEFSNPEDSKWHFGDKVKCIRSI
jgi:hypothetical protein